MTSRRRRRGLYDFLVWLAIIISSKRVCCSPVFCSPDRLKKSLNLSARPLTAVEVGRSRHKGFYSGSWTLVSMHSLAKSKEGLCSTYYYRVCCYSTWRKKTVVRRSRSLYIVDSFFSFFLRQTHVFFQTLGVNVCSVSQTLLFIETTSENAGLIRRPDTI